MFVFVLFMLLLVAKKKNGVVHTCYESQRVRSAPNMGSGAHHTLVRSGCDKVVSEQAVLGVCLRAVSSRVLFMGV